MAIPSAGAPPHGSAVPRLLLLAALVCAWPTGLAAGEPVPITLHVENLGGSSVDLYLTGRPVAFDLLVTDEEGAVVWRRLEGEIVAMALRIETLAPGASLRFRDTWDQRTTDGVPVPPGTYTIRGELPVEDGPLITPTRVFSIAP